MIPADPPGSWPNSSCTLVAVRWRNGISVIGSTQTLNCITLLTIYFHNQSSYTIVGVNKIFKNVLKYVNAFELGNSIVHVRQIIRSITNDIRVQRKMNL